MDRRHPTGRPWTGVVSPTTSLAANVLHLPAMAQGRAGHPWRQTVARQLRERSWLRGQLEWVLLFGVMLLAVWLAIQSGDAPQVILLVLLYVVSIHFSIPVHGGAISPVLPVVAVSSLFIMGWPAALLVLAGSFLLAEFARPLWLPLWQNTPLAHFPRRARAGRAVLHLLALAIGGWLYGVAGGMAPFTAGEPWLDTLTQSLRPLLWLAGGYGGALVLLSAGFWRLRGQSWRGYFGSTAVQVALVALLSQPFALFGALTLANVGLPGFVLFCVGAGAFAISSWIAWQRRAALQQQLDQFAQVNALGISLRQTLQMDEVLALAYRQVNELIGSDHFTILLQDERGRWQPQLLVENGRPVSLPSITGYRPDDFTRWVIQHGRVLSLDEETMHYAARHNLTPPQPRPAAWLGVPLLSGQRVSGVMVLQRSDSGRPFSLWSQEMLLAVAGHISAAIQNARLYSEVVRLYNLTDEALAARVQQLQALLDSTHEGVLMLDTTGRILLVNPLAARLLGRPRHELQQQPLDPAGTATALGYEPQALQQLLHDLRSGQQPPGRSHIFETRLSAGTEDGRMARRFIERTEGLVMTGEQQVLGWLMMFDDVTEEQERAEWRLNATRMIVHDLRNPLTTLNTTLNLIAERLAAPAGDPQLLALTAVARRGGEEMLDMVDSLMDMTRMEAGQLVVDAEAMHLPPLLARVVAYMQPLALKKGVQLAQQVPAGLPPVWGDEEILRRVLVNLLDNALKFTPAGGQVQISLQPEPADENAEPGVRCLIEDSGPGIPAEYKSQIFDRFVRINAGGAQVRGTGLGLTFCKLALEAHGGRIWVEDSTEGGSRFVFIVPGVPLF